MSRRVLVAGLGNVLMSDDAAGPYCIEHLIANYDFPDGVVVADLGTPGLDLALHLSSADVVVAVDALRGVEPGTVHVFDGDALLAGGAEARLDTHAPALEESILIARLAGGRPADVRLVGLGGTSFEHGTGLSPLVQDRMELLCERVLAELTALGIAWTPRQDRVRPDVWWEQGPKGSVSPLCVLVAVACLLLHASMAAAGQAPAPAPSNDDCAACHTDPTLTRSSGSSVAVDLPTFTASKHGEMLCVDCHVDLAGKSDYPHAETLETVNCASCHGDIGTTYDDSIHARARVRSGLNVAPACANCHGSHNILGKSDPKSRVAHAQVPATCGSCHEGIKTRFDTGVHAAALQKGDPAAPSCATCHTAHAIQRTDTDSGRLSVTAECGTCHLSVVESYARTFHGKITQLGSGGVAACSDCHSPHEILPASNAASTIAPANLQTTCGTCHTGVNASFVRYDPHPNPDDYSRSPVLWWANSFYWILIPGCFGFFGLHSVLWFWRARTDARLHREDA